MARDRQKAKQRQADRRAARLAQKGTKTNTGAADPDVSASQSADSVSGDAELAAGAPPEELGRSDAALEPLPPAPADDDDLADEDEFEDVELAHDAEDAEAFEDKEFQEDLERTRSPTPGEAEERGAFGKVALFLRNVWAELQRVQWPDRRQVTTLTGVVLGFVLIAGGYLGLLDAIFSRVVEKII